MSSQSRAYNTIVTYDYFKEWLRWFLYTYEQGTGRPRQGKVKGYSFCDTFTLPLALLFWSVATFAFTLLYPFYLGNYSVNKRLYDWVNPWSCSCINGMTTSAAYQYILVGWNAVESSCVRQMVKRSQFTPPFLSELTFGHTNTMSANYTEQPHRQRVLVLILQTHFELLDDGLHVIGAGLYECGYSLLSIRRYFEDTGIHP